MASYEWNENVRGGKSATTNSMSRIHAEYNRHTTRKIGEERWTRGTCARMQQGGRVGSELIRYDVFWVFRNVQFQLYDGKIGTQKS